MPETLATSHHLLAHGRALLAEARADRASWVRFAPSLAAAAATAAANATAGAAARAAAIADAVATAGATAAAAAAAAADAGATAGAAAAAETGDRDLHAADRRQLAWALQYDATAQDAELIRAALTHEVSWRKLDPSQGIGETLELLAWLVARDRRRDDLWLLSRAKLANFDTGCGFDREHLAAALYPASTEGSVEGSADGANEGAADGANEGAADGANDGDADPLAYVREHAPSIAARDAVLELLAEPAGAPAFSAADLSSWLARKERDTPRDPAAEPLETWLDRALFLGDRPTARRLLAEWLAGRERDAECLAFLANRLEELGDHDAEATARDELLLLLSTPADRASERCRAAIAARRAGQWGRALDHLDHAALLHRPRRAWLEIGRGRFFVHEAYELALAAAAASRAEIAQRALVLADELAPQTPNLPPITLELQARAATLQAK